MGSPPALVAGTLALLGAVHSHGGFAPLQCITNLKSLALIDIALQRTNKLNVIIIYMMFCLNSWTVEDKVDLCLTFSTINSKF